MAEYNSQRYYQHYHAIDGNIPEQREMDRSVYKQHDVHNFLHVLMVIGGVGLLLIGLAIGREFLKQWREGGKKKDEDVKKSVEKGEMGNQGPIYPKLQNENDKKPPQNGNGIMTKANVYSPSSSPPLRTRTIAETIQPPREEHGHPLHSRMQMPNYDTIMKKEGDGEAVSTTNSTTASSSDNLLINEHEGGRGRRPGHTATYNFSSATTVQVDDQGSSGTEAQRRSEMRQQSSFDFDQGTSGSGSGNGEGPPPPRRPSMRIQPSFDYEEYGIPPEPRTARVEHMRPLSDFMRLTPGLSFIQHEEEEGEGPIASTSSSDDGRVAVTIVEIGQNQNRGDNHDDEPILVGNGNDNLIEMEEHERTNNNTDTLPIGERRHTRNQNQHQNDNH